MSATFRLTRLGPLAAAVLLAATLAGCSSVVDNMPHSMGGLPDGTPARPATAPAYPAVHDMPPSRQDPALTAAESKRLREDLTSTRNRLAPPPDPAATGSTTSAAGGARNP